MLKCRPCVLAFNPFWTAYLSEHAAYHLEKYLLVQFLVSFKIVHI